VVKLLHTSDWHLGKRLLTESLHEAHYKFIEWLIDEVCVIEKPDVVIIAGDVFDRAVPTTEAIELFEETLARLNKLNIKVFIIAGNHDSRVRLGANSRFMELSEIHFRTRTNQIPKPLVIKGSDGEVVIYGIPYLEPDVDAGEGEFQFQVEATQHEVMNAAMQIIKSDFKERQTSQKSQLVVVAHSWIVGALSSESERNTKLGNLGQVDASVFQDAAYVAMGHLHGAQTVQHKGDVYIRYSGSPIPYSFSEKDHQKQVVTFEIGSDGLDESSIKIHLIPQVRGMQELRGSSAELLSEKFPATEDWVKIVLTDADTPLNIFDTLKRKFPHLLELIPERVVQNILEERGQESLLHKLLPEDVTKRFVERVTGEEPSDDLKAAIDASCEEVRKSFSQVTK